MHPTIMHVHFFLFLLYSTLHAPVDLALLRAVYFSMLRLRDGSVLATVHVFALNSTGWHLQRLLGVGNTSKELLPAARELPDDRLLGTLLLAVAGNLTVEQRSVLSEDCGTV